jgi:hypothetical protein
VNAGFGLDRRLVTVDDESSPYGKAQVTVDWGGDVTFGESERALFCEINENLILEIIEKAIKISKRIVGSKIYFNKKKRSDFFKFSLGLNGSCHKLYRSRLKSWNSYESKNFDEIGALMLS